MVGGIFTAPRETSPWQGFEAGGSTPDGREPRRRLLVDLAKIKMLHCPLCNNQVYVEISTVAAGPIRTYWQALGVDLDSEFGEFPENFTENRCIDCGLHFFEPLVVGTAVIYDAVAKVDDYYTSHKWEFQTALEWISEMGSSRLLEVGCGEGHFLRQASRVVEEVTGVELDAAAAEIGKVKGLDIRNVPVEAVVGPFDLIASFQVMEHLQNPGEIIRQCIEKLSPGGALILAVPNQDGVMGDLAQDMLNLPPHHVTRWERRCLDFMAERYGLDMEQYATEPLGFGLYAAACLERLASVKLPGGIVARAFNGISQAVHRARLPMSYLEARRYLLGHTHMAVFRKPGGSGS